LPPLKKRAAGQRCIVSAFRIAAIVVPLVALRNYQDLSNRSVIGFLIRRKKSPKFTRVFAEERLNGHVPTLGHIDIPDALQPTSRPS